MKRRAVVFLVLLFAAMNVAGQDVSFTWAFVKQGADGSPVPLNFSEKVSIAKGDLFKIYVHPSAGTYVYLILQDAQGELTLLYPGSFEDFSKSTYGGSRTMIPPGEDWFTLDSARGTERFHLLATSGRLAALEKQVTAWQKVAGDQKSSPASVTSARQAVMDEIARVRKAHSQVAMGAEKPVTIAGGTRGLSQDVEKRAVKIDANEFYTRTFRLEH